MIPLTLPAEAEATAPYVARLGAGRFGSDLGANAADMDLVAETEQAVIYSGPHGLLAVAGASADALDGDIVLVEPQRGRAQRLIRSDTQHNTLTVTEQCDQLCSMCSQPPKKTHEDRFAHFTVACLLAALDSVICLSGGEPTLHKEPLFRLIEEVHAARPDLGFQVLTNGQHFTEADIDRLAFAPFRQVRWGIPLYAADAALHDEIVGKTGAYDRLLESFAHLLRAGARIELRTVVVADNLAALPALARFVTQQLRFIERWSIMQLEHTGFARTRWRQLYVDHRHTFAPLAQAVDTALARGIKVALFNFPRCSLPEGYRLLAPVSIADWKRRYAYGCEPCRERDACSDFFEWHPITDMKVTPL